MFMGKAPDEAPESDSTRCLKCSFLNPRSLKFCGNCGTKLPLNEPGEEAIKGPRTVKCGNCGFQNPGNLKYCGNCGAKIKSAWRGSEYVATRYEALALLQITGSSYLLISLLVNALVQASYLFLLPYTISMILGFYAGYKYYSGKASRNIVAASVVSILLGLIATFLLFIIGLQVRGVIGPAWVIFAINLWFLYKTKDRLTTTQS